MQSMLSLKKSSSYFLRIFTRNPLFKMLSLTSLSSGWKLAVRKAKKIRNKVDNIVHNYPELPDKIESIPVQIGKNVSVKEYNTFLDCNESSGYKFYWKNKNVYIVDMASRTHEVVVNLLQDYFKVPNGQANHFIMIHPIIPTR